MLSKLKLLLTFLLFQGLELFSQGGQTIFLVLSSPSNRNTLYTKLVTESTEVNLDPLSLEDMTQQWQIGKVSNYEYLMFLNL